MVGRVCPLTGRRFMIIDVYAIFVCLLQAGLSAWFTARGRPAADLDVGPFWVIGHRTAIYW